MNHEEKVKEICRQIKERAGTGGGIKISKKAVDHFVPNPYDKRDKKPKIDIRSLNDVIKVDPERMICIAESGVTFSDLVSETLKHNLVPYTVPELKGITIGGAVSGCSIESMSYKHGGFHDSCLEYEIVNGDGEVITCSPGHESDIFHMIHGSYGTLGILTQITMKLVPAKPFVKMTYEKFDNYDGFWSFLMERCHKGKDDFIDAIVHGPAEYVACVGNMVGSAPYLSSYDWLNIFYKSTSERKEDYLKIYDYFFRYDTECHWLTKTVPLMENRAVRFLVGKKILGSTNLIKWSRRLKNIMKLKRRPEVVVDVFIPENKMGEFNKWYEEEYQFYPLWIVPYKAPEIYPWINEEYGRGMGEGMYIDCAVYGKKNNRPDIDYSEILEKKTIELNGIKTLISRNHFNKEDFWKVYNHRMYTSVKSRTDPKGLFGDLYKKFHPDNYR